MRQTSLDSGVGLAHSRCPKALSPGPSLGHTGVSRPWGQAGDRRGTVGLCKAEEQEGRGPRPTAVGDTLMAGHSPAYFPGQARVGLRLHGPPL